MGDSTDFVFNGLNGANGAYFVTASPAQIAQFATSDRVSEEHLADVHARLRNSEASLGVVGTVRDASDLSQTGWGVIFSEKADPSIREALAPLLAHRRADASRVKEHYYQEFSGPRGYHSGETTQDFLRNRGARTSGSADPDHMPYYLLIVGDPETIPYSFQYQLDVQYAVGRISFDTVDEYASYASSVVRAETANPRPRRVTLVGVSNDGDRATRLTREYLVEPLAKDVADWAHGMPPDQQWELQTVFGSEARKERFAALLGGAETPSLLFTASHGAGFAREHPRQSLHQGALVCQDWPGPRGWSEQPLDKFYFSADDVSSDASLEGLIAFHFACFSVGTPRFDDLPQLVGNKVQPATALGTSAALPIASRSFAARLPQRLLGHPRGGALAVIGHVERALGSSFLEEDGLRQRDSPPVFRGALNQLLHGDRLGVAIEPFNERYADVCSQLEAQLGKVLSFGYKADPVDLAKLWMGAADARGYAIFGDPAVRLVSGAPDTRAAAEVPARTNQPTEQISSVTAGPSPEPAVTPQSVPTSPPSYSLNPLPANVRMEMDPASGRIILTITPTAAADETGSITYGFPFSSEGAAALQGLRDNITSALSSVASRVGNVLSDVFADVSTLQVSTYISDDIDAVSYDASKHTFQGPARRRLVSAIRLDGNAVQVLPSDAGELDPEVWKRHAELLDRAQAHRMELIKALSAAVGTLVLPIRPG